MRLIVSALAILCIQGIALGQVQMKAVRLQTVPVEAVAAQQEDGNQGQPKDAPECLRPLINAELSFIKRVCEPTDEQMKAIVEAAKEAHKALASIVTPQGVPVPFQPNGGAMFMGMQGERISTNPYLRVREDIAKLLEPLVSAEQYAKYAEESKLRDVYEREAAVGIVLDMIDAKLVLSVDQRKEIFEKLMKDWKEVDLQWLQNYRNNPHYMPNLPEQLIAPSLTDSQKKIWTVATQQKVTMYSHIGQGNPSGFVEEWIEK